MEVPEENLLDELYRDPLFDRLLSRATYVDAVEWQEWFEMYPKYKEVSDIARTLYRLRYFEQSAAEVSLHQAEVWGAIENFMQQPTETSAGVPLMRRMWKNWMPYAAVVLATIAIGLWFSRPLTGPSTEETVYAAAHYPRSITLPDGSTVVLNKDAYITYRADARGRHLALDGEAYLHVSQKYENGAKVPFIVSGDGFHVEVLGTRFNVINTKYTKVVALDEGKVSVSQHQESLVMQPGQVVKSEGGKLKRMTFKASLMNAWQTRILQLNNTTLDDITEWLELTQDVEIVNSLSQTQRTATMSGQIDMREEANLYRSLSNIYHVEIRKEGDKIILKEKNQ